MNHAPHYRYKRSRLNARYGLLNLPAIWALRHFECKHKHLLPLQVDELPLLEDLQG